MTRTRYRIHETEYRYFMTCTLVVRTLKLPHKLGVTAVGVRSTEEL